MSGTSPFPGNTLADVGRIVEALQKIVQMQGQVYQQLKSGVAVSTWQVYTVAALPATAAIGQPAYASDGRKPAEGGGSGTGVPVWYDVSGVWFSYCSGMQVTS